MASCMCGEGTDHASVYYFRVNERRSTIAEGAHPNAEDLQAAYAPRQHSMGLYLYRNIYLLKRCTFYQQWLH